MSKIIFAVINSVAAILVIGFSTFGFMMAGGYAENIHTFQQMFGKLVLFPALIIAASGGTFAGWVLVAKKDEPVSKVWKIISPLPLFILIWLVLINFF